MKKLIMIFLLGIGLIGFGFAGAGPGVYGGGGPNQVEIGVTIHPISGNGYTTYGHGSESNGPYTSTPDAQDPGTIADAPATTFSNGKEFRIKNGKVQVKTSNGWKTLRQTHTVQEATEAKKQAAIAYWQWFF